MVVRLLRYDSRPDCTLGLLFVGGTFRCHAIEREWADNRPSESCIPAGAYKLAERRYNRGGYQALEVQDVPGRTHILIHAANRPKSELLGCIAPGESADPSVPAVWNSRKALGRLLEELQASGDGEHELIVEEV